MIYLLLYGLLLILAMADMFRPISNKKANAVMLFLIVVFTLFRGLRWDTGTDWESYLELFERASFSNIFSFDRYGNGSEFMEPGIVFINALFNTIFPYTVYLLATNAFILWGYKRTVSYFLPKRRVFAFCFLIISVAFFPVRQEIANVIIMLSLPALLDKKYKQFILLSILAVLIHKTAAFMLVAIFIIHRIKLSSPILLGIFFSSLVLGITVIQSLASRFAPLIIALNAGYEHNLEYYTESISEDAGIGITSIIMPLFLISLACFARHKSERLKDSESFNMFLNLMTAFFSLNLLLGSTGLTQLMRLTKYLFFADAFVLAYVANNFSDFKKRFWRTKAPLFFMMLLVGLLSINRFNNKCQHYPELMFPYHSVFSDKTRNETPVDFDYSMLLE